jgi:hypothetical protein
MGEAISRIEPGWLSVWLKALTPERREQIACQGFEALANQGCHTVVGSGCQKGSPVQPAFGERSNSHRDTGIRLRSRTQQQEGEH